MFFFLISDAQNISLPNSLELSVTLTSLHVLPKDFWHKFETLVFQNVLITYSTIRR